jgi:hypothetical protein
VQTPLESALLNSTKKINIVSLRRNHALKTKNSLERVKIMPVNPYEDYQKTGLDKMIKIARTLCRLVQTFEIIIRAKFPDSVPINALLSAIAALCLLIPEAETEFRAYVVDATPPPSDALDTVGIDESAPPAASPDLT